MNVPIRQRLSKQTISYEYSRNTRLKHAVINLLRYSACQLNPYACSKIRGVTDVTDETFLFIGK